jgi:hypothetical protein
MSSNNQCVIGSDDRYDQTHGRFELSFNTGIADDKECFAWFLRLFRQRLNQTRWSSSRSGSSIVDENIIGRIGELAGSSQIERPEKRLLKLGQSRQGIGTGKTKEY